MDYKQAKLRAKKLREEINDLRYRYHVLDDPSVTDEVYDSLTRELKEIEEKFPKFRTPDSPTQRVGGKPLEKFEKVPLTRPMLSLNDAFSEAEVREWNQRLHRLEPDLTWTYFCDVKYDGLAIELVYEHGTFQRGSTRGDGEIGENVTNNLRTINSIPLKLPIEERFVVRGEVVLFKNELERINKAQSEKGGKVFANTRNAAAGAIRQKNPRVTASRKLVFYPYGIVSDDFARYPTHQREFEHLRRLGFEVNSKFKIARTIKDAIKFHESLARMRSKLPFEIDGTVIRVNENDKNSRFGIAGKAPRGSVAYKFSAKKATTVVEDVKVQVGRQGNLTPVAIMRPVEVGGVTVARASLHNEDEIKRLGLKVGDTVVIQRAGDVIPQVVEVLVKMRSGSEKDFHMPKKCPVCSSPVERRMISQDHEQGAAIVCTNRQCPAKNLRAINHLVSAFEIYTIGPKIIERFKDEGLITDAADIFRLKKEDIEPLERFGEKSADNIIASIKQHREISLSKFIYALGILHVGEETSIDLAEHFGGLDKLIKAPFEEIDSIPNVGGAVTKSVHQFFQDKYNLIFIDKLLKSGVQIKHQPTPKNSGPLMGKKVIVTGTLKKLSRDEAKVAIRKAGGDVVSAVSKNTDYLVVGENPGSKLAKSEKFGVKILDEMAFLKLLGHS